jgi:hypothetical protein
VLLNFFKVRAIINGSSIYLLEKNRSVIVDVHSARSTIVVTNGYHYTKPFQVANQQQRVCHFTVVCAIDDDRLLAGTILTCLFFLIGLTSGIVLIKLLSFVPTIYFLYLYYINKKEFIQIKIAS